MVRQGHVLLFGRLVVYLRVTTISFALTVAFHRICTNDVRSHRSMDKRLRSPDTHSGSRSSRGIEGPC